MGYVIFILALIAVVVIIAVFVSRSRRQAASSTIPKAAPARQGGRLNDYEIVNRLHCFPTRNPLTGEPLKFDAKCNEEKLRKAGLPVAGSIEDLARIMGVAPGELYWLMSEDGRHYTPIELKTRTKKRLLFAPKSRMKACQRWILKNILDKVQPHQAAEGFRKTRSVLTHAKRHSGKSFVATLDIHRFFDTVRSKRVYGLYRYVGYSEEAALALSLLTTRKGRLPQGAPTSPAIANLVCIKMDARLNGLAKKFNATYSRYADDMAVSGDKEFAEKWGRFMHMAKKIIAEEGFKLNPDKMRRMRDASRQYVTGLVVNKSVGVPRARLRKLRAILHNAKKTGLDAQNRINHKSFRDYLRGNISYVSMISPDKGRKMLESLKELA